VPVQKPHPLAASSHTGLGAWMGIGRTSVREEKPGEGPPCSAFPFRAFSLGELNVAVHKEEARQLRSGAALIIQAFLGGKWVSLSDDAAHQIHGIHCHKPGSDDAAKVWPNKAESFRTLDRWERGKGAIETKVRALHATQLLPATSCYERKEGSQSGQYKTHSEGLMSGKAVGPLGENNSLERSLYKGSE
jgi:hypothetical protein